MGRGLISNLKRMSYLVAASVLFLETAPVLPIVDSLEAFAEGATSVSVGSCDELTMALGDANVSNVAFNSDLSGCAAMNLTSGKIINGNNHYLAFSGNNGFNVKTNDAITINNLTVTTNHRGINIDDVETSDITLDGVVLTVGQRGISYTNDVNENAVLNVKNSTIQLNGISDYDTQYRTSSGNNNRGITLWNSKNSTVNITNSTIQGFEYDVNVNGDDTGGTTFNVDGSTFKGRDAFNIWANNDIFNVKNSNIVGINNQSGPSEAFADFVLNSGTSGNTTTFENVDFANSINGPGLTNPNAIQMMLIDYGTNNTTTFTDCDFKDTAPEGRVQYLVWDSARGVIVYNSGTYDLPVEDAYLADGKVNYLVDGRYVVADAPDVSNVPKRVLVEAGVDSEIEGLDDETIQMRGKFQTNGGTFTKPNIINATRVANASDLNLTFDIYKVNDDGQIVPDTSYNRTIKIHAYEAEDAGDIFMMRGETIDDLDLNLASNNYTTLEVKTEDESVATIETNDDGTYSVEALGDGETTILGKVTVNSAEQESTDWMELGTLKVYSLETESEIKIPAGTRLGLTDEVIAEIGNPSLVTAKIADGGEEVANVSGTSTEDGELTALAEGDATVEFYVNDEKVGETIVHVYELQNPQDILLSTLLSQGAGDLFQTVDLRDTNISLRDYTLTRSNNNVLVNNTLKLVTASRAGETEITVRYDDSLGGTTETFTAYVSEFIETADDSYDMAEGSGSVQFRMSEAYNQNSVSCVIDGHDCESDNNLTVTKNMANGTYTVEVAMGARSGEYVLEFTDTVGGMLVAEREVTIRVHEIELSEDELYVKAGDSVTIEATEKNDFGTICENVWHRPTLFPYNPGHYEYECNIAIDRTSDGGIELNSPAEGSDEYEFTANEAGEYTVTFSDGVASKTATIYVFDFTVNDLEYHVKTTDTAQKLINAINKYWKDTENSVVRNIFGFPTNSIVMTKVSSGSSSAEGEEYFFWPSESANAGRYTVDFSALVNGRVVDTQTVTIHLYEMYHPSDTEFYGEMSNLRNIFRVSVGDYINLTESGMADIDYEVIEGDPTGITVGTTLGLVYVTKPGKYVVKYTDTMNRGNGELAGEYTATFEVYNLDANAPDNQIVDISENDTYTYEINPSNTYGDVQVTINMTRNGETTEVYNETLNYPGETEEVFEFVPTEEGRYDVRIENLSAAEHRYREVETGSFYVIQSEFDFMMVEKGKTVEIQSGSYWDVTSADLDSETLTVEDGKKVTIDTSEMELGVYDVNLYHRFSRWQREAVKTVTLVVYSVVADENTAELNPGEVTVPTIKGLYDGAAEATADLVRKLIAGGISEAQVVDFVNKIWDGTLTDEDIEALGYPELFEEFKAKLGLKDNEWLSTLNNLNEAASYGEEVAVEVKVTDINDSVDATEKADIEEALAGYNVDHIDYYDVSVLLKVNDDEIGKLHKLNGKITVALAKTEDPAAGYSRQYFVVRDHEGTVTVLTEGVDFYIEDGVIYVISDEFSTYAVAYKDTLLPKTPDTGDEVVAEGGAASVNLSTAIVVAIATLTLVGAAVFAKRR